MKKIVLIACLYLGFSLIPNLKAQTAIEIIENAENKLRGNSSYFEISITSVRPKWSKEMKLKSWTKGIKKSVSVVTYPAKEKGTAFLMKDNEVWNYMPTIERVIKLPPSMMLQNWMGTDLTNDDLVKQSSIVVDYNHKLLGEEMIESYSCWKIELLPKENAPVVWGKILMWIEQKDYMQLKVEFYDEDDFLINKMLGSKVKSFSGKMLPSVLEFIPVEEVGHKTIIEYLIWDFNVEIPDNYFSTNMLKRMGRI